MNVGLIDIEPKIVNTALMQISAYHKLRGDDVAWALPLEYDRFDVLYCSSLFDFSDKSNIPSRAICGGTGFNVKSKLSPAIESFDYDYSIYPDCDYSIVWFSRGCNNKCGFCVVPEKEGRIKPVKPKSLNPTGRYIVVQDNSFFDNPEWKAACEYLKSTGQKIDITNANIRTMTPEKCKALAELRLEKSVKVAWDNPKQDITSKLKMLLKYISHHKIMCYVLIGYWSTPEEDLYRVETLRSMGIAPFVMSYNKKDIYQRRFANWVNKKSVFMSCKWEDYKYKPIATPQP